ncbi:hypothetical protein EI546_14365 [Aequorivita sp. H23M31]|uniref:Uncharacterized protein n=1 Tax=Aequorivita ciconiae TaxID=2494375 RepID=A0A410G6C5_9FLAO|nr:DUF6252 family protein [Aequorivita sp. H23M31]QAA82827.1 hypothetical protein EI546_14365 [Aequorivita sp. H23M31]
MKTFKKSILILMAVVAVSLTSCKKDDDGGGGGSTASGTVSAKVNGSGYTSDVLLTSAILTNSNGTSSLLISANTMNGKNITLSIMSFFDGVGTYNIGGGANVFTSASYTEVDIANPTNQKTWVAPYDETVAGEIKVSEITDTFVKGTFYFNAKSDIDGTREITEGSFNVNLQ